MSRKVVRLTVDHFVAVDAPCQRCLFWELDPVRRGRVDPADAAREKQAWISEVLREWGSVGRVALVDEVPVGYVIYAPSALVPGAASFPTAPTSADAVLLTTAYVVPRHRGAGLGRMLIQGMAADLTQRGGIRAVECFAGERPGLVPPGFLDSVGFKTQRPHPITPRMRMDLTSTLRWRDELESTLSRLLRSVRPSPGATRQSTGSSR
ncbi:MAG: GNAT family N-acetyltransferase [Nocardioides sp.]